MKDFLWYLIPLAVSLVLWGIMYWRDRKGLSVEDKKVAHSMLWLVFTPVVNILFAGIAIYVVWKEGIK